jgi:hypothetical protein
MSPALRYLILVPLSLLAIYALFVLPDVDLGWPGGLALLGGAWLVWYLLWATLRKSAAAARIGDEAAIASPGEQRAWIGLVFTAAILGYYALRASQMVAADGSMAPEAAIIGRHIGFLIVGWLVVMRVLRKRWRDTVEMDERDRIIDARANAWARWTLSLFVLALAVLLAFSPLERLHWVTPMALSNLMMVALIGSSLLEYAVTGVTYWRDRH